MTFPPTAQYLVGIGEALFDCFPDQTLLGGAPVNFTIHAAQLLCAAAEQGAVASRVGTDSLGAKLRQSLTDRAIHTDALQEDSDAPTGTVQVTFDEQRQPHYEIVEGVAWDNLQFTAELQELADQAVVVCFGTLAQRSQTSRDTIHRFLQSAEHALRVCDLNFRPPYVEAAVIDGSLKLAQVVKLNEAELDECCQLLQIKGSEHARLDQRAALLRDAYDIDILAVTRGSQGTILYGNDGKAEGTVPSYSPEPDADSVGAGDASCAGLVAGLLTGMSLSDTVNLANRTGAFVATRKGATPPLPREIVELVPQ